MIEPPVGLTMCREGQFHPPGNGGKPDEAFVLFDAEAAGIVSHPLAIPSFFEIKESGGA
jgi:hypothetical protein